MKRYLLHHRRAAATEAATPANPWLPVAPAVPQTTVGEQTIARPAGPTIPQPATVFAPPPDEQLPTHPAPQVAPLWWLGVHGGAGESTLAALEPTWLPAQHAWPAPPGAGPVFVVLVARTHARGLAAARAAARQWAAGLVPHVNVLGLVLIPDAPGRLPRPLREEIQLVSGAVARTWTLPWVEPWRLDPCPVPAAVPREARRLVADLRGLITIPMPPASPAERSAPL